MRILQESDFRDGASNMAIDCAIAEAVSQGSRVPTLRLYGWTPFCLSLGYGQRARDVDRAALAARDWDLVRRPTGGKAILHGDELTYSLCLPLNHELATENVIESYRRLSAGLLRALAHLGIAAQAEPQAAGQADYAAGPVCFVAPSHFEITVAGRKVIGSAQLRRRGVMLQHGTIPLAGDVARICDVLQRDPGRERQRHKREVRQRAATLAEIRPQAPAWLEVAQALERGFTEAFELEFLHGELSPAEAARAAVLKSERFNNPSYTLKR